MSSALVHHDPPVYAAHIQGEAPEIGVMGGTPDCERLVVVCGGSVEYDLPTVLHAVDDLDAAVIAVGSCGGLGAVLARAVLAEQGGIDVADVEDDFPHDETTEVLQEDTDMIQRCVSEGHVSSFTGSTADLATVVRCHISIRKTLFPKPTAAAERLQAEINDARNEDAKADTEALFAAEAARKRAAAEKKRLKLQRKEARRRKRLGLPEPGSTPPPPADNQADDQEEDHISRPSTAEEDGAAQQAEEEDRRRAEEAANVAAAAEEAAKAAAAAAAAKSAAAAEAKHHADDEAKHKADDEAKAADAAKAAAEAAEAAAAKEAADTKRADVTDAAVNAAVATNKISNAEATAKEGEAKAGDGGKEDDGKKDDAAAAAAPAEGEEHHLTMKEKLAARKAAKEAKAAEAKQ